MSEKIRWQYNSDRGTHEATAEGGAVKLLVSRGGRGRSVWLWSAVCRRTQGGVTRSAMERGGETLLADAKSAAEGHANNAYCAVWGMENEFGRSDQ